MSWNLSGAPWLIAHRAMLPVNQPKMFTVSGKDYVLWQNSYGEVSALENTCPHMGADLSKGWICQEHNTIVCPYHALELLPNGSVLLRDQQVIRSIAKPLNLIMQGDLIWTYGNEAAKIPVTKMLEAIASQWQFVGTTPEYLINSSLLSALEINHDYNHQQGTYRDEFRVKTVLINDFQIHDRYNAVANVEFERDQNMLGYLQKSLRLISQGITAQPITSESITSQSITATIESYFPSITILHRQTSLGKVCQVRSVYPVTETKTAMFVSVFLDRSRGLLNPIVNWQLLRTANVAIRRTAIAIENLAPRFESRLKLSNEEPMDWARQLYHSWSD
jgi:nitrite reductase/ring-hydroxylating ferredoxin subunit